MTFPSAIAITAILRSIGLTFAIREVIACLSVYRTYADATRGEMSERDRKYIEAAVDEAKKTQSAHGAGDLRFHRRLPWRSRILADSAPRTANPSSTLS